MTAATREPVALCRAGRSAIGAWWRAGSVRGLATTTLLACLLAGCEPPPAVVQAGGPTMGTHWKATVVGSSLTADQLETGAQAIVDRVNDRMSNWDPGSELSRFNATPPGQWVGVSAETASVVAEALRLAELSAGAFDPTIAPLVRAWGFGPDAATAPPTAADLAAARAQVDWRRIEVRSAPPALRKSAPAEVDLSAIAQGYGADAVAAWLESSGIRDYLVDVGGEMRVLGRNGRGEVWRIGVEVPDEDRFGVVQTALQRASGSIATSGDYRNFHQSGGTRVSHTIDPRTGHSIDHALASVTVIAGQAMTADGMATVFNVLGPDEGFALAERLDVAALFIIREPSGQFAERRSTAWQRLQQESP